MLHEPRNAKKSSVGAGAPPIFSPDFAVGSDQADDVTFIEVIAQAAQRFALGFGVHRAGERYGPAKPQVSHLR